MTPRGRWRMGDVTMKRWMLLALSAAVVASPGLAKTKPAAAPKAPAELKWMDGAAGAPGGGQFAVV